LDWQYETSTKGIYSQIFYVLAASTLQQSIYVEPDTLLRITIGYGPSGYLFQGIGYAFYQVKSLAMMGRLAGFPDINNVGSSPTALLVDNNHYKQILQSLSQNFLDKLYPTLAGGLPKGRLLIQIADNVTDLQVEDLKNGLAYYLNTSCQSITNIQDQIDQASNSSFLLNIFFGLG